MKRSAFASLIGVSKQMVSKYEGAGHLVTSGSDLDPLASLAALEGRLDEAKRQRALQVLQSATGVTATPAAKGATPAASAKAEKDAIERDIRLIELGKATGALVLASDVDAAAREAVSLMRETFHNAKRELAQKICATFDVPPEKATALARLLGADFERALGRFASGAAILAAAGPSVMRDEVASQAEEPPAPQAILL